jgi:hypothetical protein
MKQDQSAPTASSMIDHITSRVVQTAPWLTELVIGAVRKMTDARKIARIQEVLDNVLGNLKGFQSELAELYVKTPDFTRILEQTLHAVGDEPHGEKRKLYAAFLTDSIVSPLESAEKQSRMLDILKQLKTDHVRLLRTLMNLPATKTTYTQSPLQMLGAQIPDIPQDRMRGLLTQLTELGISTITDWSSGTYGDVEQIRKSLTTPGRRLVRIIGEKPGTPPA